MTAKSNYQKPGLQGRVLAVNSGWNFVVLSVGDKQGVVINSTLLVVRGNEPIARLRVTSVEPSTSIADVLPGHGAQGHCRPAGRHRHFRRQPGPGAAEPQILAGNGAHGSPDHAHHAGVAE